MTGLLNIAKCLYDAIHRLKKKAARAEANDSGGADLAASVLQVGVTVDRLPVGPVLCSMREYVFHIFSCTAAVT